MPLGFSSILLLVELIGRWRWPVITANELLWFCSLELVNQILCRWLEAPQSSRCYSRWRGMKVVHTPLRILSRKLQETTGDGWARQQRNIKE